MKRDHSEEELIAEKPTKGLPCCRHLGKVQVSTPRVVEPVGTVRATARIVAGRNMYPQGENKEKTRSIIEDYR